MADPLSIATGVVTFMAAVNGLASTIKKLYHIRHARPAIAQLENEMTALRYYVENVNKLLDMRSETLHDVFKQSPVQTCLETARGKVEEVNTCLHQKLHVDLPLRNVKKSMWLSWDSELNRMRQELRDVRVEIGTCLSFLSAAGASQIGLQIESLSLEGRAMDDRQSSALRLIQQSIAMQRPVTASELEEQLASLRQSLEATIHEASVTLAAPSIERRKSDSQCISHHNLTPSIASERVQRRSSSSSSIMPFQRGQAHVGAKAICRSADAEPMVKLQLSQRAKEQCNGPCSCQCHRSSRYKTPDFLRQVVGQLLIGYSGIASLTPPCNEYACALRQKATVRLQYHFPMWSLIQRVITVVSDSSGARGPENVLRVSRVRPGLDEVFIQVQSGNVHRLQQLFAQGLASPLDASDTGWTLLHYATAAQQLPVVKFLKDAGADPHAESARRDTPFDNAWNGILSGRLDRGSEKLLREVFCDSEHLDRRQFSTLHKIVLGFIGRDLQSELESSTASIDEIDSTGYTPLAWAAARGDFHAVSLLVEHGASIDIENDTKETPIHLAAQSGNVKTISTLVNAGADINLRVAQTNMTPLHFVAEYQDSADAINKLANMSACLDGRDFMHWTPLHWASWRGHSQALKALLELGANVNAKTGDSNTAVILAVANNSHECVSHLISAGADCRAVRSSNWSVLHYAAISGSLETLHALSAAQLTGIDVDASKTLDTQQTVMDMLEVRFQSMSQGGSREACDAWIEAWSELMASVPHQELNGHISEHSSASISGSDDEDEIFTDAESEILYSRTADG